jgi:hypothetical protein
MGIGASYGLLLGIVLGVLGGLNSPTAWASFWAAQTILLAINARLTWQRTGLFWMTFGASHAAIVSAVFVLVSMLGFTIGNLPSPWNAIFWVNALAMPVWMLMARLVHRDEWRRWKHHMEPMSLRDMFMFRHIPHLK